jgi:hypothetical protein
LRHAGDECSAEGLLRHAGSFSEGRDLVSHSRRFRRQPASTTRQSGHLRRRRALSGYLAQRAKAADNRIKPLEAGSWNAHLRPKLTSNLGDRLAASPVRICPRKRLLLFWSRSYAAASLSRRLLNPTARNLKWSGRD